MKTLVVAFFFSAFALGLMGQSDQKLHHLAFEKLMLPQLVSKNKKPVVVAVIDDAFRLSHRQIQSFVLNNKNEIAGNKIDDDNDGWIDNVIGWDLADADNDVNVPEGESFKFYHGTMVAGIVCELAEKVLGAEAGKYVSILPLKVISDQASTFNYELGYEAVAYAIRQNVDIIVMAWSGGRMDKKHLSLFDEAASKGIAVFVSAGNFYSERLESPASLPSVFTVAAVDTSYIKTASSNYNIMVDAVAFGDQVRAPHSSADNAWFYGDGTSSALALVAGCAAILKVASPESKATELYDALKNTAQTVDNYNLTYATRLGAGLPNLSKAVNYLLEPQQRSGFFDSQRPQGKLIFEASKNETTWLLAPHGGIKAFHFMPVGSKKPIKNASLSFFVEDVLTQRYNLNNLPLKLTVEGSSTKIVVSGKRKKAFEMYYETEAIDSTILYCSETKLFSDSIGQFDDGSGELEYANRASCKWQIQVPEGKRVKIQFTELDTQPNVDFVYIFNGDATLQENLLAQFSGNNLPPVITSFTNQVLIWFATDKSVTGKGWTLHFKAVDDAPGVGGISSDQLNLEDESL